MGTLSLLTPTGGRPEAFAFLERWIEPQLDQVREWIVVDDCVEPTKVTMGQTVIRPRPYWRPGQNTLGRNLAAGLEAVTGEKLALIEDDEAYSYGYLKEISGMLECSQLVGMSIARYYNLPARRYRVISNKAHASLCQTGIRRELFTRLRELARRASPGIDLHLWQGAGLLRPDSMVVSMKGMPGRAGIGIGHRPAGSGWWADPAGEMLASWLGREWALRYATFDSCPSHRLTRP